MVGRGAGYPNSRAATAFIFVIESGATVKEAQSLARHTTPEMTMNVYGRVREEQLAAAVDKIAERLGTSGVVPADARCRNRKRNSL